MCRASCNGRLLLRLDNPEEDEANTNGKADGDKRVGDYDYQRRLDSCPVYRLAETNIE